MTNGSNALATTPSSVMNSFIQIASCAASEAAMYSDSVEEFATTLCLALLQLTAAPFKINTYPDCDFESSGSVSQLASVKLFVTSISKKHILCPFQVLQDILNRCPVFRSRITLIYAGQTNSMCDIRSHTQHSIHDRAYGRGIGDFVHPFSFFCRSWTLIFTQGLTWKHGQEPFLAFIHSKLL